MIGTFPLPIICKVKPQKYQRLLGIKSSFQSIYRKLLYLDHLYIRKGGLYKRGTGCGKRREKYRISY